MPRSINARTASARPSQKRCYFFDPNGNTMANTTEFAILDEDTWHPGLFDTTDPQTSDQWGTANAMNEFVTPQMFNDVDKSVFVAPPV